MAPVLLILGFLISFQGITDAQSIGVCYGKNGDNLPPEGEVVSLYQTNGIGKMRIYFADKPTLEALRGSNIELILDVPGDQLGPLGDAATAASWVQENIVAFASDVQIKYIAVGNEVEPGSSDAGNVPPAMQNIQNAIVSANLQDRIKVSTAIKTSLLAVSSPPSAGVFGDTSYMQPIVDFLKQNGSPLLANVYTYFSLSDPNVKLDFALFNSPATEFSDGPYEYQNLFDATLDALYAALEKVGAPDVKIVVSESGWPSDGGNEATTSNAETYYRNLINHVNKGTPRRPGQAIETYLFAMFDENMKAAGTEQHFGLFRPDKESKYGLTFG